MADQLNRRNYEGIQRDLIRTAIKQPLLTMIRDPDNNDRQIPVIVEANDEYYAGKEKAVEEVRSFVKAVAGVELRSIGSEQNPYYKTSLTPPQILEIVDRDDTNAFRTHAVAMGEKQRLAAAGQAAATPPEQLARYLAIRRVWYNHPINPLIDISVSTVKADAAHRA